MTKKQITNSFARIYGSEAKKIQINDLKVGDVISLDVGEVFTEQPHLILDRRNRINLFDCSIKDELEFTFQLQSGERYDSCGFNKNQFVYKYQ